MLCGLTSSLRTLSNHLPTSLGRARLLSLVLTVPRPATTDTLGETEVERKCMVV